MPDCQMCWNEWQSLQRTPIPQLPDAVQVCRNCGRSMSQVLAFVRHHGVDLSELDQVTLPGVDDPKNDEPKNPPNPPRRPGKK